MENLLADENIADQDRVYVSKNSDRLGHANIGSGLCAGEWRVQGTRVRTLLDKLRQKLDSNEDFRMDDSFNLSLVHVCGAPKGSGPKCCRSFLPGRQSSTRLREMKKCIIQIPRNDTGVRCSRP